MKYLPTGTYKDREVNFVVKKGLDVCQLIQVCSNIENPQTKELETKSLIRAMYEFSVDTGMIITDDFEAEEEIKGRRINYRPLWVFVSLILKTTRFHKIDTRN